MIGRLVVLSAVALSIQAQAGTQTSAGKRNVEMMRCDGITVLQRDDGQESLEFGPDPAGSLPVFAWSFSNHRIEVSGHSKRVTVSLDVSPFPVDGVYSGTLSVDISGEKSVITPITCSFIDYSVLARLK